jgi:hypothetical protein
LALTLQFKDWIAISEYQVFDGMRLLTVSSIELSASAVNDYAFGGNCPIGPSTLAAHFREIAPTHRGAIGAGSLLNLRS